MDSNVAGQIESDDIVLNVDVSDDGLERAAALVEGKAITWAYCTHVWYNCGWPQ